jgi:hypothetical protein
MGDGRGSKRSTGPRHVVLASAVLGALALATLAVWAMALGSPAGLVPSVEGIEELILSWGVWGVLASILPVKTLDRNVARLGLSCGIQKLERPIHFFKAVTE